MNIDVSVIRFDSLDNILYFIRRIAELIVVVSGKDLSSQLIL